MKKISILFLGFILLFLNNYAQDTLRVVQYNLLYYGLEDNDCNSQNNNINDKTNYLKTIVSYLKPHIFAVNEINALENYHDYLLANVFLYNGFSCYHRAEVHGQYLTNQIFYNYCKLGLLKTDYINAYPRDVFVYKFYYKSPDLQNNADTIFIWYFLNHFKAGDQTENQNDRANTAQAIIDYITEHNLENKNIILSGDLNLYTSEEPAYQKLTNNSNPNINFVDPGESGAWHENQNFALLHSQSTHYYSNGCASGGGLNDRFDFILFSQAMNNSLNPIHYINGSFKVIGQDGQHFNMSVNYNGNNSVPSEVLNALANNSDHLPVYAEFFINQTPAPSNVKSQIKQSKLFAYNNPVHDILKIQILSREKLLNPNVNIEIFNVLGQKIFNKNINLTPNQIQINLNLEKLKDGIYFVKITNNSIKYRFSIIKE